MIKINLLGTKERPKVSAGPQINVEGAKLTVLFVIIIALGAVVLVGHYVMLNRENARLTEELGRQEAEKKRLAAVRAELEVFEKRQALLIRRYNIIDGLRKSQSGPVNLLNTLASTVSSSEQLWLTSFENDGVRVNIDGVAGNVNTVADFIGNLKRTGQFKVVEIKESYQDDRFKEMPTFVFSISAEQVPPAPSATPTPGGASSTPPRT